MNLSLEAENERGSPMLDDTNYSAFITYMKGLPYPEDLSMLQVFLLLSYPYSLLRTQVTEWVKHREHIDRYLRENREGRALTSEEISALYHGLD